MNKELWVIDRTPDKGFYHRRLATDAEVLAAAATLPGAKRLWLCVETQSLFDEEDTVRCDAVFPDLYHESCGWRLVIPLPDKETPCDGSGTCPATVHGRDTLVTATSLPDDDPKSHYVSIPSEVGPEDHIILLSDPLPDKETTDERS